MAIYTPQSAPLPPQPANNNTSTLSIPAIQVHLSQPLHLRGSLNATPDEYQPVQETPVAVGIALNPVPVSVGHGPDSVPVESTLIPVPVSVGCGPDSVPVKIALNPVPVSVGHGPGSVPVEIALSPVPVGRGPEPVPVPASFTAPVHRSPTQVCSALDQLYQFQCIPREKNGIPINFETPAPRFPQVPPPSVLAKPAPANVMDDCSDDEDLLDLESMDFNIMDHITDKPCTADLPDVCGCHTLPAGSCPLFIAHVIRLVVNVRGHRATPNMDGAQIPLRPTIDPIPWAAMLGSYFDKDALVAAFTYGWDLSLKPDPSPTSAKINLPSALRRQADVDKYVSTELRYGCLVGPLPDDLPFSISINPLGAVPKANSETWRTVTDCSQKSAGINAWIPHDSHRGVPWKIRLPSTETIVAIIARTRARFPGSRIKMFKFDFSRFYRFFLVDPSQIPFLAIKWRGQTYLDRVFSFGNRGAMHGAQRTSSAVAWMFRTQVPPSSGQENSGSSCRCTQDCDCGDNGCCSYVDDVISVAPEEHADFLFRELQDLISTLTLSPSTTPGHIVPPSTNCTALGVEFLLDDNIIRLPQDKLDATLTLLVVWLSKTVATRRELASICGKLLHCSRVIPPGRIHLGRMLETKRRADRLLTTVPIDAEFRNDVSWWHSNMQHWNGRQFLEFVHTGDVAVDASSDGWFGNTPGVGAFNYVTNEFFASGVPEACQEWLICDLELVTHLIAARIWGHQWYGCQVSGLTDNESCRYLLERGRTRCPLRLSMVRSFTTMQFSGNFRWRSARVSTKENNLADAASRLGQPGMEKLIYDFCAGAGVIPVRVPVTEEHFTVD